MPPLPSVFLCYRRADEPFATALLGRALIERLGGDRVFLDTVSLGLDRAFAEKLIASARRADVMLVVVGAAWDEGRNRERLDEDGDWIRREVREAQDARRRIVLVLVERDAGPLDLPTDLAFLHSCETVELRRPDVAGGVERLADLITGTSTGASARGPLDSATVELATLAMIGHVLPDRQQFSGNDEAVAQAVAENLAPGEWLRFVGAGNSPGRPGGSGVVMVIDGELRLVQLRPRPGLRFGVEPGGVASYPLRLETTLRSTSRRSWRRDLVDVQIETPPREPLRVLGLFPRPAEIFVEAVARSSRPAEG